MKALLTLSILLIATLSLYAQPSVAQSDSPCNQGRSDPDPRNAQAVCFPEFGRMQGMIGSCKKGIEQFGGGIYALDDVNHDSLNDWMVSRTLCDTIINIGKYGYLGEELLLYKGVRGGLPDVNSGQRIGPTEIGSSTKFLASGDWDGDGNVDIACSIQLYGDTTGGNRPGGFDTKRVVIFWGNPTGQFSLTDTTHIIAISDLWAAAGLAASGDFNHDGIADLLVAGGGTMEYGKIILSPILHIFKGHAHQRWGRQGVPQRPDWGCWNRPPLITMNTVDQDGDGATDVVLYANSNNGDLGYVSVLYGNPDGGFPDSLSFQGADLHLPNGKYSLFQDVTGDGIPELLVQTGVTDERVKVYLGVRGQRLAEQFGGGDDKPPIDGTRWWGRPWAEVWLPNRVRPNWLQADPVLLDFGDGNLDGIGDIWAYSHPYLLCYSGGQYLDSLADGLLNTSPAAEPGAVANLGNIDGSGVPTLAFGTGGGIIYFKASRDVPFKGKKRTLPDGTGPAGVQWEHATGASNSDIIRAIPNPAHGEIRVEWNPAQLRGNASITLTDMRGAEMLRMTVSASKASVILPTTSVAPGSYFVTITAGMTSATTAVAVR